MTDNSGRIPSLDGIRAVSIALVILGHLSSTRGMRINISAIEPYAEFGVRVFFIISGFLITSILLKELDETGNVDLKRFYIRRAYRIFPAAYVFMAVVCGFAWARLQGIDICMAVTYTSNYHSRPWPLAHLWSLAVEEQFYLLWPALLAYWFRARAKVLVAVIVGTPLLNVALFYFKLANNVVGFYFPTVADGLAVGCLLSISQPLLQRFERHLHSRWMLLVPLATLATPLVFVPHSKVQALAYYLVLRTVQNIAIAVSIHVSVLQRWRLLNCRPVAWLGVLSYSFYLWQQPFLDRSSSSAWTAFPLNLVLALSCAVLSYYLIERPALQYRARKSDLFVPRSPLAAPAD